MTAVRPVALHSPAEHCAVTNLETGIDYGGSSSSGGFRDQAAPRGGFDEYDAGEDEAPVQRSSSLSQRPAASAASSRRTAQPAAAAAPPPPKAKQPEVDLLGGFGDDDFAAPAPGPVATNKALPDPLDGASHIGVVAPPY